MHSHGTSCIILRLPFCVGSMEVLIHESVAYSLNGNLTALASIFGITRSTQVGHDLPATNLEIFV